MQTTELRPLGAGELLDRAVTLFVRQFGPIVLVLAAALVPVFVAQALADPSGGSQFSDLLRVFTSVGSASSQQAARALSRESAFGGPVIATVFLALFIRLLMWGAVIALVASAYDGARISFARAYGVGVRRWLQQIVLGLAFAIIAVSALIPVFIAYIVVVGVVAVLAAAHLTVPAIVVGVVGGLVVIAAFALVGSFVFMVYETATVTVVTETPNPFTAMGIAFRRAFARGMRRRTAVAGLIIALVSEGGALPLAALAITVSALTHIGPLYYAILGVGSLLLDGLVAAFVVVYAVDARVRREGIDLVAQADSLAIPA